MRNYTRGSSLRRNNESKSRLWRAGGADASERVHAECQIMRAGFTRTPRDNYSAIAQRFNRPLKLFHELVQF